MGRFERRLDAPSSRPHGSCFRCWNHGLVNKFNRFHVCKHWSCCCDLCVEAVRKSKATVASRRGVCRTAGSRRQGRDEPAWRGSPDVCISCGMVRCVCRTAGPRRQDWDGPAWTGSPPDDGEYQSLNECSGCGEVRRAFSLCYRCWNHGVEEEFSRYHVCKYLFCRCDLCIWAEKDYHDSRKTGCMCKTSKTIRQNHNDSPRKRPLKRSRNVISTTYFCECGHKVDDCVCNSSKKAKLNSVGAELSEEAGGISEEKSAKKLPDTSSQSTTASSTSTQRPGCSEEAEGTSRKQSESEEMKSHEKHGGSSEKKSAEMLHHTGKSTSSSSSLTNSSNPKKLPDATGTIPVKQNGEISRPSVCSRCSELRWRCICSTARAVRHKADRPVHSAQPAQSPKRSRNYIVTTYYCKCGNNVQSCKCQNAKQANQSPTKANRSENVGDTKAASLLDGTGTKSNINGMSHATKPEQVKSLDAKEIEASKKNSTQLIEVEEQMAKSSDDEGTDMSRKKATELCVEDKTAKSSDINQIKTSNEMSSDTSRVERCALKSLDTKEVDDYDISSNSPGVKEWPGKPLDNKQIEDHDMKSSEPSDAEEWPEEPSDIKKIEASPAKGSKPSGLDEMTAKLPALQKIETNGTKSSESSRVEELTAKLPDVNAVEVCEKNSSNSLEVVEWAGKPSGVKKIEDHDIISSESLGMEENIVNPSDIKTTDMKSSESAGVEECPEKPSDIKEIEASQSNGSEPPGVEERTANLSVLKIIETNDTESSESSRVEELTTKLPDVKAMAVPDKNSSSSLEVVEWAGEPSVIKKIEDRSMKSSESLGMEEIIAKPLEIKAIDPKNSHLLGMEEITVNPLDINNMKSSESSGMEEYAEEPSDIKEIEASQSKCSEPPGVEERIAKLSPLKKIETNDTESTESAGVEELITKLSDMKALEVCDKKSSKSLEVVECTTKPLDKKVEVFQKKSTDFFEVEEWLANPSDVKDIEASDTKSTEPLTVDKQTEKALELERDIGAADKTRTEAGKVSEDAAMNRVMEARMEEPTSALCEEISLEVPDEPCSPISTLRKKLNESGTSSSQLVEEVISEICCALPLTTEVVPAQGVKTRKEIENKCVLLIPEKKQFPIELSEEKSGRDIVVRPTWLAEEVINDHEHALPKSASSSSKNLQNCKEEEVVKDGAALSSQFVKQVKSNNQDALTRTVTSSSRDGTLSVNAENCLKDKSDQLLISGKNTDPSHKGTRDNICVLPSQLVEQVMNEETVQPVTVSPKFSLEGEIHVLQQSAHLHLERKKNQNKPCQGNLSIPQCKVNPISRSVFDGTASNVDNSAREIDSGDPRSAVCQALKSKQGDSNKLTGLEFRNVPMNEGKDPSQQELAKLKVSRQEDAIRNAYNFSYLRCEQCKAMRFSKTMLNLHSSLAHGKNREGMYRCRKCPYVSNQDMFFVADHEDVHHMGLVPLDRVASLLGLINDALDLSSV